MKQLYFGLILFGIGGGLSAQNRFTLTGYVKDSLSSETLIGAALSVDGKSLGVNTNQYGFFSITLPGARYSISCSFVGYQPKQLQIDLSKNSSFNFLLSPKISTNQAVIVYSTKRDANVKNAQMGQVSLSSEQVKTLPVLLGEADPMKSLQLLPGVQNAGEGNTGLYVRGGGPDQNLIMLDDAIVYNTGHLFGFFSIFNADAIKNVTLIKGDMPAQYGGRLSSVVDVTMKEGNMNKFEGEGGIGLIASRLSFQGPLRKNKASFIVSARRTYIDVLTKPFIPRSSNFYGSGYYFYDLNLKVNYSFSEKDRLYLSGYFGRDVFNYDNAQNSFSSRIPWGNATASLRWNHVFTQKLFANTTLVYNKYNFSFGAAQQDLALQLNSGIRDLNAKTDFDYYVSTKHKVKFGGLFTYHTFTPNILTGQQDSTVFAPDNTNKKYANEMALYAQDEWDISEKLKINAGLRWSVFSQIGPYTIYQTDSNGNKLDSTVYRRGQPVKTYGGPEPRLTLRYAINDQTSLKMAVTHNLQYIHLVSNSGTTLPTDLWVPSTYLVKPQTSWQYSTGVFRNFNNNMFETSVEIYYKSMQHQIEYEAGYVPSLADPETQFVFGKGWSYGSELYVNKSRGRLTGWIGYTLSWSFRQFPLLNDGEKFYAKYDRRHDLSVVATYELNKHWKLSAVFVYGSGNAITLPTQFYIIGGVLTQEYSKINQYRMPPYDRLDLSAIYSPDHKPSRKIKGYWVFSVYNAYDRLNPYFIYFNQTGSPYNGTLSVQAKQVSLFPIIPSVTWNFKF